MNYFFRTSLAVTAVLAAGGWAFADTILMKDSTTIDGKILSDSGGLLRVQLGDREVTVPSADVASVEKNDKTAPVVNYDDIERLAKERDRELTEKTGLAAPQRAAVDEMLKLFFLAEESAAKEARRTLLAMVEKNNPYRYLEMVLPEIIPPKQAPLLEVMFEMNPEGMRETLKNTAHSSSETARAACLRCLAEFKDASALDLMKRGLVDEFPEVRIAAARGVLALRAREATPLLLKALTTSDMRVQNAAREALSALWTEPGQPPLNFLQNAGWEEFWKTKAATVPGAWDPAAIEPLVEPGTAYQMD